MLFSRYMRASTFVCELEPLRAFRGSYIGTNLLESLERARLLLPRLRIRFPDAIARRFWLKQHEYVQPPYQLKLPVETDSPGWDAAVDFTNALHRWQHIFAYGLLPHPLDDPDPRFESFIERPDGTAFVPWLKQRVDVSNDRHEVLFDDHNFDSYYTTWQLLMAAESADAGIHYRINLIDVGIPQLTEDLFEGKAPKTGWSLNFKPVYAARDFVKHEKALDAVVWFAEERSRALEHILKDVGGRFRVSSAQIEQYEEATVDIVRAAAQRHQISTDDLIALIQFLAERWSDWNRDGRPKIAEAYEAFLERAVIFARRLGKLSFAEMCDRVGQVGGWFKPILDVIWPNWAEEEKERARLTLQSAMTPDKADPVSKASIDAFVEFLANNGLEAFFWRLRSFEDHALRGNEFAREGMKSDLQGMAIAVEHVAAALGATETQLYEKFKQLWRDADVLALLKRGDIAPLARQTRLASDWSALKRKIDALRAERGGKIAADLVMAHRIRGGVHAMLPEDDHFELEALFVGLMRAAVYSFIEVRGTPVAVAEREMDPVIHAADLRP